MHAGMRINPRASYGVPIKRGKKSIKSSTSSTSSARPSRSRSAGRDKSVSTAPISRQQRSRSSADDTRQTTHSNPAAARSEHAASARNTGGVLLGGNRPARPLPLTQQLALQQQQYKPRPSRMTGLPGHEPVPGQQGRSDGGSFHVYTIDPHRLIINVSGETFETQRITLERFPYTLLGNEQRRKQYWDGKRNEYFFDRHRTAFQAILYFYQSGGRLRRPLEVPEDVFLDELKFFDIGEKAITKYRILEGFSKEPDIVLPKSECLRNMYFVFEDPDSSMTARVVGVISILAIAVSIINFCVETLPQFEKTHCLNSTEVLPNGEIRLLQRPNYGDTFFIVESICIAWFTIEFVCRMIATAEKVKFLFNFMNIVDVIAIVPYYAILITVSLTQSCESAKSSASFLFLRVLRVFRVFKLSKHSQGLRILGHTMRASVRELGLFFFFLTISVILFAGAIYYAEEAQPKSQVTSIPDGFWWAVITMSTVGYGDVVPVGILGKLVGTMCVISGALTLALPVPIIVANFNNFYRHETGRGVNLQLECL